MQLEWNRFYDVDEGVSVLIDGYRTDNINQVSGHPGLVGGITHSLWA